MPTPSGDTMPTTFTDPSLDWSGDGATETTSPVVDPDSLPSVSDLPPASATTSPETPVADSAAPPEGGPIPLERHKAVLEDERKLRSDLQAKLDRVAWAETLTSAGKSEQQVREALDLYDGIDRDPAGFLERFYARLENHPTLAPLVRSWAGKVLGGNRQTATTPPHADNDPEPPPDYEDRQTGATFFSRDQQAKWNAWNERRLKAEIGETIRPLIEDRERAQQRQQEDEAAEATRASLATELAEFRKNPVFVANEPAIKQYLASTKWRASIADAFDYVTKVILPLASTAKAQHEADLQTRAAASSLKPNSAAPVTPGDVRSLTDSRLKW